MKTCILITAILLLLAPEYSQGCKTTGYHMRKKRELVATAPELDEDLAIFFGGCEDLAIAAGGILDLSSAVDYVIRDSNWYKNVASQFCHGNHDTANCWVYALRFLLDPRSPLFVAAANCMFKWAETNQRLIRTSAPGTLSSYYLLEKDIEVIHCSPPKSEHIVTANSPKDNEISNCLQSQSECEILNYPSLTRFNASSVTTLLKDHYTYCSTITNFPSIYDQGSLANLLCATNACPFRNEAWRMDIMKLYGVATGTDAPIGVIYEKCQGKPSTPCNPCKNGGECVLISLITGKSECMCKCRGGYTGMYCEKPCQDELPVYCPVAFAYDPEICQQYGLICPKTCSWCEE